MLPIKHLEKRTVNKRLSILCELRGLCVRSRAESPTLAKDRQSQIPTHSPISRRSMRSCHPDVHSMRLRRPDLRKGCAFPGPANVHAAAPPIGDLRQSRRIAGTMCGKAEPVRTSGRQAARTANGSASPAGFVGAKLRAFFKPPESRFKNSGENSEI